MTIAGFEPATHADNIFGGASTKKRNRDEAQDIMPIMAGTSFSVATSVSEWNGVM